MNFAKWAPIFLAVFATLPSGCGDPQDADQMLIGNYQYWNEVDEFSGESRHYLDTSRWIEEAEGEFLRLQFQCFRNPESPGDDELNLVVTSEIEMDQNSTQMPRYVDAVLYKQTGQQPQIYRNNWNGDVLSTFQQASLDLRTIFAENSTEEGFTETTFRFVIGASPVAAQLGDVATLARAPSIDLTLSMVDAPVARFFEACRA
ncbi:MAG: hypothetical protein ABF298_09630 [Alteriqipengyuania sp.]|uniref:hypothetical protein n=1 Tax=Alteriqipengyuania sp. TaxID=2800692 RepID=UPI0032197714